MPNLFVVESPLQALCALELSLHEPLSENYVVARLSSGSRSRNDEQMLSVLQHGQWADIWCVSFQSGHFLSYHASVRRVLGRVKSEFRGAVESLFIGEFRSEWMHHLRSAVVPERTVLLDDGAAIIDVKARFLNQGVFFPVDEWRRSKIKRVLVEILYYGFRNRSVLSEPILTASAFCLPAGSGIYREVDFSAIRKEMVGLDSCHNVPCNKVFFFGSKYSEAGIVDREVEKGMLRAVKGHYDDLGLGVVYFPHRDESEEKLEFIQNELEFELNAINEPAELYLLSCSNGPAELAGAYSTVLNNARCFFPDLTVKSFVFDHDSLDDRVRSKIVKVYKYLEESGVIMIDVKLRD